MKIKKYISIVLSAIMILAVSNLTANASEINTTSATSVNNLNVAKYSTSSHIRKMQEQVHKNKDSQIISTSTSYVRLENTSTDPQTPKYTSKAFTLAEYNVEKNKENSNEGSISKFLVVPLASVAHQYSWINLTLEVDKSTNGNFDVYGFYEWLTLPFFTGTDFLALTHDSNVTFNQQSTRGSIMYDTYNSTGEEPTTSDYPFSNTSSGFTYASGNAGYKFGLSDGVIQDDYGYMSISAQPTASSSNIVFTYEHEQLGISVVPSISFPGGVAVRISAASAYAEANVGIQAVFSQIN